MNARSSVEDRLLSLAQWLKVSLRLAFTSVNLLAASFPAIFPVASYPVSFPFWILLVSENFPDHGTEYEATFPVFAFAKYTDVS